jgi:hypothetical protein
VQDATGPEDGPIGEDHLRTMLDDEYGVARPWYKATECVVGGVPWIVEVMVADTVRPGRTWFACNHAPAFGDPLERAEFDVGDIYTTGAKAFLMGANADTISSGNRAAVVHVICGAAVRGQGPGHAVVPSAVADCAGRRWTRRPRRCGRRPRGGARTPVRPSGPSSGRATRPRAGNGRTSGPSRTPSSR